MYRVYCQLGLNLKRRTKKRLPGRYPQVLAIPASVNQCWSMDFMSDCLYAGRRFRTLNIVDDFNREVLAIEVDLSLTAERVVRVLNRLSEWRGLPQAIRVDNGTTTTLTYDARRRLLTRTIDSQTTTYTYDGIGNITKTTLPHGSFLTYEYDAAQRLTAVQDNLRNRIEYTLDKLGNRTQENVKDPSGTLTRTLSRTYNSLNRLTKITGGANQATTFAHDTHGNPTSVTVDAITTTNSAGLNQQTSQAYDALNRISTSTDATNGITTYTYDARDNLTSVTDAKGYITRYTYSGLDDLTQQQSPDTGTTRYGYDSVGNRTSQIDARGISNTYSYDALNRLTNISYPDSTQNVTYTYDSATGCNKGKGRLCKMADASGSTTYSYDARGNLSSQTTTIGSNIKTTRYTYNGADQLTQMTYPGGRTVDYTRNTLGQISGVTTKQGSTASVTISSNMTWKPFGPMSGMTYGNNLVQSKTYDLDYRLTQILTTNGSTHQNLSYTHNAADNITRIADTVTSSRSQTLVYDKLNRLTDATSHYGDIDYAYDTIGNRTRETNNTVAETYSYKMNSHQLTQKGTTTYTHAANGNMTDNSRHTFTYGDNNRLKHISVSGSTIATHTYTYNGRGERVKKSGNSTTYYHYDPSGQLIAETDTLGNTQVEYIYIDSQPAAIVRNGTLHYIHPDHLGTPQKITNQTQATVWEATYTPFGKATITTSTITNNLRFPGQYYDQETNLHDNHFRYYDPTIGRYITSDPIGLIAGLNTYSYVNQNPVSYYDPTGLICGTGACVFGATFGVGTVTAIAHGISAAISGGDIASATFGGFAFGAGATLTGILSGGSAIATGLGVGVGLGIDAAITSGSVIDMLVPDAGASSLDPVNEQIQRQFCLLHPDAPNCREEVNECR